MSTDMILSVYLSWNNYFSILINKIDWKTNFKGIYLSHKYNDSTIISFSVVLKKSTKINAIHTD